MVERFLPPLPPSLPPPCWLRPHRLPSAAVVSCQLVSFTQPLVSRIRKGLDSHVCSRYLRRCSTRRSCSSSGRPPSLRRPSCSLLRRLSSPGVPVRTFPCFHVASTRSSFAFAWRSPSFRRRAGGGECARSRRMERPTPSWTIQRIRFVCTPPSPFGSEREEDPFRKGRRSPTLERRCPMYAGSSGCPTKRTHRRRRPQRRMRKAERPRR